MRAIVQDRYGSADVLRLRDVEKPVAGEHEVLVRVHAASLNARDWHVMRGDPYLYRLVDRKTFGRKGPNVQIPGTDFAGVVEVVGPGVRGLKPGDEVYGEGEAAFAEYVRVGDDRVDLKPANSSFEEAAAVPLAGNTALMGVRDIARITPGQRLLINGASGGVGTFAVQIAKAMGAHVTGVCSTRNVELIDSLGADAVIDYRRHDFVRSGQKYDVVLDLVGNRSLADLRRVLTPTGTLVLSGGGVFTGGSFFGPMGLMVRGTLVGRFAKQRIEMLPASPKRENLAALRDLIESGAVRPAIDRTYKLLEVPDAMRYLEGEHARAKVVVTL